MGKNDWGCGRGGPAACWLVSLVAVVALTTVLLSPAWSRTWLVPDEVSTIAGGLAVAAEGDTVLVACGTYYEHEIALKPGVSLIGAGDGPDPCVMVDAGGLGAVLFLDGPSEQIVPIVIEGFSLVDGHRGLDVRNLETWGSLTMRRCTISGNGFGILNESLSLHLEDCTISANTGRGIWAGDYSGGAVIERCRIEQNMGGAVAAGEAYVTLRDCVIAENYANEGPVLFYAGPEASLTIDGCTITRNVTAGLALIYIEDIWSDVQLSNSVVAYNLGGQAVWMGGFFALNASCTDVVGNEGGDWMGPLLGQEAINGNLHQDPRFCDLLGRQYRLAADSPLLPENSGACGLIGALGPGGCALPTDVPERDVAAFGFTAVMPNPFNPRTTIVFALAEAGQVELAVYDLSGRRVRSLVAGETRAAGRHEAAWDGRDDHGRTQPAGLYICRLTAGQRTDSRRLMLVK